MPQSTNPIDAAAADFGRHSKGGGGWALGLAVAACVKPGTGNGRPPRNRRDHDGSKISAQDFARRSNTSADRVLRHLKAWARAAEQDLVAPATDLAPADWSDPDHIPTGWEWGEFYDASGAGSRPRDSRPEHAAQIIGRRGAEAVIDELTDEQVEDLTAAATERRPEAAQRGRTRPAQQRAENAGVRPRPTGRAAEPDTTWMEADREIGRMHSAIVLLSGWVGTHPDMMRARADRLTREAELARMLAEAAAGTTTNELEQMLREWAGEA